MGIKLKRLTRKIKIKNVIPAVIVANVAKGNVKKVVEIAKTGKVGIKDVLEVSPAGTVANIGKNTVGGVVASNLINPDELISSDEVLEVTQPIVTDEKPKDSTETKTDSDKTKTTEQNNKNDKNDKKNNLFLYAGIGLGVLVLGFVGYKMLKKNN